jgi:hypothetical protein
MTTKVTIDAHAGWPVEVVTIDTQSDGTVVETPSIVSAGQVKDVHVWQGRQLRITELPEHEKPTPMPPYGHG